MKLTTKLLLGATLVAGLSVSAFAACANNVLMGDKQLKDVADATDDKDAVNYAQVLKRVEVDIPESNASKVTSWNDSTWNVSVSKIGNVCEVHGLMRNTSGATINTGFVFGVLPVGYRPVRYIHSTTSLDIPNVRVNTNGELSVYFGASTQIAVGGHFDPHIVFMCN